MADEELQQNISQAEAQQANLRTEIDEYTLQINTLNQERQTLPGTQNEADRREQIDSRINQLTQARAVVANQYDEITTRINIMKSSQSSEEASARQSTYQRGVQAQLATQAERQQAIKEGGFEYKDVLFNAEGKPVGATSVRGYELVREELEQREARRQEAERRQVEAVRQQSIIPEPGMTQPFDERDDVTQNMGEAQGVIDIVSNEFSKSEVPDIIRGLGVPIALVNEVQKPIIVESGLANLKLEKPDVLGTAWLFSKSNYLISIPDINTKTISLTGTLPKVTIFEPMTKVVSSEIARVVPDIPTIPKEKVISTVGGLVLPISLAESVRPDITIGGTKSDTISSTQNLVYLEIPKVTKGLLGTNVVFSGIGETTKKASIGNEAIGIASMEIESAIGKSASIISGLGTPIKFALEAPRVDTTLPTYATSLEISKQIPTISSAVAPNLIPKIVIENLPNKEIIDISATKFAFEINKQIPSISTGIIAPSKIENIPLPNFQIETISSKTSENIPLNELKNTGLGLTRSSYLISQIPIPNIPIYETTAKVSGGVSNIISENLPSINLGLTGTNLNFGGIPFPQLPKGTKEFYTSTKEKVFSAGGEYLKQNVEVKTSKVLVVGDVLKPETVQEAVVLAAFPSVFGKLPKVARIGVSTTITATSIPTVLDPTEEIETRVKAGVVGGLGAAGVFFETYPYIRGATYRFLPEYRNIEIQPEGFKAVAGTSEQTRIGLILEKSPARTGLTTNVELPKTSPLVRGGFGVKSWEKELFIGADQEVATSQVSFFKEGTNIELTRPFYITPQEPTLKIPETRISRLGLSGFFDFPGKVSYGFGIPGKPQIGIETGAGVSWTGKGGTYKIGAGSELEGIKDVGVTITDVVRTGFTTLRGQGVELYEFKTVGNSKFSGKGTSTTKGATTISGESVLSSSLGVSSKVSTPSSSLDTTLPKTTTLSVTTPTSSTIPTLTSPSKIKLPRITYPTTSPGSPVISPPSTPPITFPVSPPTSPPITFPISPPTSPPPTPPVTPPIIPPSPPQYPPRRNRIYKPNLSFGKFPVLLRRYGKFKIIGFGRTPIEAFNIGRTAAAKTLGATFKVPSIKNPIYTPGFKTKKTKKGFEFIELPRFRLSTKSEIAEIQEARKIKLGRIK